MGYSEVPCHLCGIVFNIGRMRTIDEPRTSAWTASADWNDTRHPPGFSWVGAADDPRDSSDRSCSTEGTGCHLVYRGDPNQQRARILDPNGNPPIYDVDDVEEILGISEGEDWMPKHRDGDDESVAEEWGSQFSDDEEQPEERDEEDIDGIDVDHQEALEYAAFIDTLKPFVPDEQKDKFLNLRDTLDEPEDVRSKDRPPGYYEHIAGPGCRHRSGYSGYRVTSQEMRGCKTLQCLAPKVADWKPEPDDLEVERTSRYFLTGISDYCPSRDVDYTHVSPERHHLQTPFPDVHAYADDLAMPFHPWCMETFIRLSLQRFNRIDFDGLMDWRNYQNRLSDPVRRNPNSPPDSFDCIPRDPDLDKCHEQWWDHHEGHEYIAANPVLVPGLADILCAAMLGPDAASSEQRGVFDLTDKDLSYRSSPRNDIFARLPSEVHLLIVEHLEPTSIASLRGASRAFRQLPQWLFHKLLRRKLPSLWEASASADDDASPYFWTALVAREVENYAGNPLEPTTAQQDFHGQIDTYRRIIKEEMPELYEDWIAAEPTYYEFAGGRPWPPAPPKHVRLKRGETDWYRLYCELNRELGNGRLKGLTNRERIWKDVSFIVGKIAECRDMGHIAYACSG